MPKIGPNRAERAAKLRERIARGPTFIADGGLKIGWRELMTAAEMESAYRGWFESWIEEDLDSLIPELQKLAKERAATRAAEISARVRGRINGESGS